MGSGAEDIANNVIENIIMPFIHPILIKVTGKDGDGTKINIWGGKDEGGVTLDFKPVIEIVIKFSVLCVLIFFALRSGAKMELPVNDVNILNYFLLFYTFQNIHPTQTWFVFQLVARITL